MHPGIPLLHLHGKQKQMARLSTFQKFTTMKHAVLFATDIAARGLDFPAVDWVLQLDAPEDAETYIHRVGRTARYESAGKGLLLLLPSEEEGMKKVLEAKGIEIPKIKVKQSKTQSIENQLQNLAFQDPEIKYLGQRVCLFVYLRRIYNLTGIFQTFVSYLRAVHFQKNKEIFKLEELPIERYAESLGLPGAPKIKFLNKEIAKRKKNASHAALNSASKKTDEGPSPDSSETESGDSDDGSESDSGASDNGHAPSKANVKVEEKVQEASDSLVSTH